MKNQKGSVHIQVVVIAALLLGGISFAGYRVYAGKNSTRKESTPSTQEVVPTSVVNNSPVAEEIKPAETPPPTPVTQKTSTPKATSPAPTKRTISFTKGGGSQQGDKVVVSANLSESQSGTCTYVFSLNGTERVRQTNTINGSNVCSKDIPVSAFPKSAVYSFSLSFASNDGQVTAVQSPYDIEVK